MKLAYLVGTYPAVSHTFIAREVTGLRALGVEVRTFSVRRPGPEQVLTDDDRRARDETPSIQPPDLGQLAAAHLAAVRTRPLRYLSTLRLALALSPPGLRARLWHLFYFAEAIVLWQWLRAASIRHVHVHFANAATSIALLSAHFAAADGGSWSFTMHGPTEFDNVESFRLAEKVARAQFVVCISDYARSQLMKLTEPEHWDKLTVVHCGVDPAVFRPRPAVPDAVSDDDEGELRILCVGRLVPEKGQTVLLEAMRLLAPELAQRVRLTIVGDGPDRQALTRAAARCAPVTVEFTGSVGQDRIGDLYAAADVFCLASFAEGVPVVLMEAMACGIPVVATRIMGIPELVIDGQSGRLVAPGRPDEFADALQGLLTGVALRRQYGEAARAAVTSGYDIGRSVDALSGLFAGQAETASRR